MSAVSWSGRYDDFASRIGKDIVDNTLKALEFWVDSANAGKIGWAYFRGRALSRRPSSGRRRKDAAVRSLLSENNQEHGKP